MLGGCGVGVRGVWVWDWREVWGCVEGVGGMRGGVDVGGVGVLSE